MPKTPTKPGTKHAAKTSAKVQTSIPRVAIVVSRYNATVTDRLLQGAVRAYQAAGGGVQHLYIAEAPGSFELIPLAAAAAESGSFAGVLALGCIIKGETRHDEYLSHAVTQRLADIALLTGVPVGLGVLTVNTSRQALDRTGAKGSKLGNKGYEAMGALLATIGEAVILRDPEALARSLAEGTSVARLMRSGAGIESPDKLAGSGSARGSRRGGKR